MGGSSGSGWQPSQEGGASYFGQPSQDFQGGQSFGQAGASQPLWQQPMYPVSPQNWAAAEYKHFPNAPQFNLGIDPNYDFTSDIERMNWLSDVERYTRIKDTASPFGGKKTDWKGLVHDLKTARMINDAFYDQPASLHGYWGRSIRSQYEGILPSEPYKFPKLGEYIKAMGKSDYYADYSDLLGGAYYKDYSEDLPSHTNTQPSYLR